MNQQQPPQDGAGGPPGGGRPAPRPEDAGRDFELKNSINTIFFRQGTACQVQGPPAGAEGQVGGGHAGSSKVWESVRDAPFRRAEPPCRLRLSNLTGLRMAGGRSSRIDLKAAWRISTPLSIRWS